MFNLSLARIMYGTNEDFHTSQSTLWASLRAPARLLARTDMTSETAGSGASSFRGLLHRAWSSLANKK